MLSEACPTPASNLPTPTSPKPWFSITHLATQLVSIDDLSRDADEARRLGDATRAVDLYRRMTELAPDVSAGYLGLASAQLALQDHPGAISSLKRACALEPTCLQLRLRLGVALSHAGRFMEAQQAFVEVLDIDPRNVDALVSLGHLCRAGRHFVEAIDLLNFANQEHPLHPDVIAALAAVAVDMGDNSGALRLLRQLDRHAPHHPERDSLISRLAGGTAQPLNAAPCA